MVSGERSAGLDDREATNTKYIVDAEAESLFGCSTNLCADSIESPPGLSGVFALATYQVDKKEIEANISANKGTQGKDEDEDQDQEPSRGPEYTRRGTCSIRSAMPDGNQRISR